MEGVCHHVNGDTISAKKHTYGFYRECGLCDVRRQYSRMSQCSRCKVYFHKKCYFAELRKQDMESRNSKIDGNRSAGKQLHEAPRDDRQGFCFQTIKDLLTILMKPASPPRAQNINVAHVNITVGHGVTKTPPNGRKSDFEVEELSKMSVPAAIPTMTMRSQPREKKIGGDRSATRVQYFTGMSNVPVVYYENIDQSWLERDEMFYRKVIENYPTVSYFQDENGNPFLREVETDLFTYVEEIDIAEMRASQSTPCTIQEVLEITE